MSDGPGTAANPRQRGGFTTIDAPPRRVAGVSHPYGRNSPHAPTHNRQPRTHSRPSHAPTAGPATTKHSHQPAPTGDFTTIDAPPRRVAGVSQPYGSNSPHTPTHNRQPRTHSRPSHDQTQPPTHANGGFTTIDTPPRRVVGVSHPYGRNSPHAPTHNRQPRHLQQAQPRPNTTASHAPTHNRQPRPRPCRFRATNLRLPLRTPRGGLPCAAWAPGRPGDIGSLSGTRRLSAPLHWCHA